MGRKALLVAVNFIVIGTIPALADQPGTDWITMDQAAAKLTEAGYADVKLKADDGRWEGKASKNGKTVEVRVDPHTGTVQEEDESSDDD